MEVLYYLSLTTFKKKVYLSFVAAHMKFMCRHRQSMLLAVRVVVKMGEGVAGRNIGRKH